jgi:hypothetical protein
VPGRCGAALRKKPGLYCKQYPRPGKTRCDLHGGKSLAGPAHPNWKSGMYSTVLPAGLAAHYAAARANPALVGLTEQIALVDAKVFELFERLAQGESPDAWREVQALATAQQAAIEAFNAARRVANGIEMAAALARLGDATAQLVTLSTRGVSEARTWNVVTSQLYLRKKLVDSEVKRQRMAHDTLTKDRALALLGYIAASIGRHVRDPKAKQAVVDDLRRMLGPATLEVDAS